MSEANEGPIRSRYEQLVPDRQEFLNRARDAALLTIPGLFPPEGHSASSKLEQPWQSVGSQGVNSLAAKVLMALMPPGSSFFRLTVDDSVIQDFHQKLVNAGEDISEAEVRAKFEVATGKIERGTMTRLEQGGARSPLYDAARNLVVGGNVMLEMLPKGRIKCHYLDSYVVKRDLEGQPIEMITKESLSWGSLPATLRHQIEAAEAAEGEPKNEERKPESPVEKYTYLQLDMDRNLWRAKVEVCGHTMGRPGAYPIDACPFIPLRWSRIDGEDYGRGHVEEHIGDLSSLESLSQSIVDLAAIAANVKFFVDPNGITSLRAVTRSKNGAFLHGNAKDITSTTLDKTQDFQVAKATADGIERRLAQAFLIGTASVRNAERVTAEEIQLIARELEQVLGGLYSTLAVEMLLPIASRTMYDLKKEGKYPALPSDAIRPQIVVGMEALGRGSDLVKLDALLRGVAEIFGQETVAKRFNVGVYGDLRAAALGIDIDGLIYTDEEVAEQESKAAQQSAIEKLGPKVIDASTKMATQPQG